MIKTIFQLYQNDASKIESSIFDFINGNHETKQTKGLAYLFYTSPDLLKLFISLGSIKKHIQKYHSSFNLKYIDSVIIDAELISTEKKRADIVIRTFNDNKPAVAFIVEAKSISVGVNKINIEKQLVNYLEEDNYPGLHKYKKVGILLTKNRIFSDEFVSILWTDIIDILEKYNSLNPQSRLSYEYYKFLTKIDKSMKYYEKEVLSIPAGKSKGTIDNYCIYECPNTSQYNFQKPLFMTFRSSGGGEMDTLYKIEEILTINPTNNEALEKMRNSDLADNIKTRLNSLIKNSVFGTLNEERKYYILSESNKIMLKHKPCPKRNNAKYTYYTLSEILDENKKIIYPESKFNIQEMIPNK